MKTNITPPEQFKILWEFFTKHGAEVEGHGSDQLSPDQKTALGQLASGNADNAARARLIPLLRSNKNALAYLGEQIKLTCPGATRKSPSTRSRSSGPRES